MITDKGQSLIAKYPSGLPVEVALQIRRDSLNRHKHPKETENTSTRLPANGVSIELTDNTPIPEELITESVAQLESALAHDILERVRVLSPSAFEQLVVVFCWLWATAALRGAARLPRHLMMAVSTG